MDTLLQQSDISEYISVIAFRQMRIDRKENCQAAANQVSQGQGPGYMFKLSEIINAKNNKILAEKLAKDEELLLDIERKKLIHLVADDFRAHNRVIAEHKVLRVATTIVEAHPTSLGCLMKDDTDVDDAAGVLAKSILGHIRYSQHLERTEKRKVLGEESASKNKRSKSDNFSKAQNFGLDPERDLPTQFPSGETRQTQEAKRKVLEDMNNAGKRDIEVISKIMNETYTSIRIDVNQQMRIEPFLKRWPFIGMYPVFEAHFEHLLNTCVNDLMRNIELKYEGIEKFFEAMAHEKSKGKGSSFIIAKRLQKEITLLRGLGSNCTNDHRFIFMIRCAIAFMKLNDKSLFVHFTDTTSFDEVEGSDAFPEDGRPTVAVLGNNPYAQETRAWVVVENRCLSDVTVPVTRGIIMAYMAYFIFKIAYPMEAAPILCFLQRKIFKIKGEGSKTMRKKNNGVYSSNPPAKPQTYLNLLKCYKAYCLTWNVAA